MANPRKFSEKIALLNQKEAQDSAAFEAIMKEVSNVTSRVASASSSVGASPTGSGVPETPLSVKSAGASPPQSSGKHLHINLGNQFRAGGSLPNVNNNVNCGNDAKEHSSPHPGAIHSIDLKVCTDLARTKTSLSCCCPGLLSPEHFVAPSGTHPHLVPRRKILPSLHVTSIRFGHDIQAFCHRFIRIEKISVIERERANLWLMSDFVIFGIEK
ncbi:hypothetical protein ALC53_03197 [Atta colombica]|uniref:Transducer of regulated CREB activity N-terminal domain-containing protein n=1 Tax=Atta colombica TaxID=520822 RepID=A0A151I5E6_9HYME|nr:hypothetical protein ALC53_03197 [Atta colombica]